MPDHPDNESAGIIVGHAIAGGRCVGLVRSCSCRLEVMPVRRVWAGACLVLMVAACSGGEMSLTEYVERLTAIMDRFVRWWCRKEAHAKLTGLGMRISMHEVEFEPIGDNWIAQGYGDCEPTVVRDLEVGPGYAAALAVPASVAKLQVLAQRFLAPPEWSRVRSGLP
jgi:hypothetical protein